MTIEVPDYEPNTPTFRPSRAFSVKKRVQMHKKVEKWACFAHN